MNTGVNFIGNMMFSLRNSTFTTNKTNCKSQKFIRLIVPISLICSQPKKQTFLPFGHLQSINCEQWSFLATRFSYIELQVQTNRIHPLQVPNGQVYNYSPESTLLQCHNQQPDTDHPTVHHWALCTL